MNTFAYVPKRYLKEQQIDLPEIEAQVEMRCKTKRLSDCGLPSGFRLVTPAPRQYWLDQQLRWGFELRFGEHQWVARYHQQVSDEMQMGWAISDFIADLMFKGVCIKESRKLVIS